MTIPERGKSVRADAAPSCSKIVCGRPFHACSDEQSGGQRDKTYEF